MFIFSLLARFFRRKKLYKLDRETCELFCEDYLTTMTGG